MRPVRWLRHWLRTLACTRPNSRRDDAPCAGHVTAALTGQRVSPAIRENDERKVEEAVLQLVSRRRIFAPLALAAGAFVMLFSGLRLLVTNWRLMLVQALPAMWLWAATLDLKAHVLHGREFAIIRGPEQHAVPARGGAGHHRPDAGSRGHRRGQGHQGQRQAPGRPVPGHPRRPGVIARPHLWRSCLP